MNVTELARKLKVPTKELLEILPAVGFGIGRRAIKMDDRQAQRVIEQWPRLLAQYRAHQKSETVEVEAEEAAPEGPKKINLPTYVRVKDFAERLKLPLPRVMAELMKNGVLSSMNEQIDYDTAAIVASELGYEVSAEVGDDNAEDQTTAERLTALLTEDDAAKLELRPPVVVVMGHVDHGKTKLLDAIRHTNVVDTESGGITQHIGAYQVIKKGRTITFIDTPGHEAFITMRSRGARIADVAVLVVAADDSIQEQTRESIKIIHSAKLPMVVAINKIDKPDANPEKVKQDLASLNLTPEDWGGQTITVPVSAKQGIGIDDLLDMILLVADTQQENLKANPNRSAVGTVIESHVNKGEGPVATLLVQAGTLRRGDLITANDVYYGKIRAMSDHLAQPVDAVGPSTPVRITGLKAAPSVGDILEVADKVDRKNKMKKHELQEQTLSYGKPMEKQQNKGTEVKTLNVMIKADVLGSLEAIIDSLAKFDHPEVSVNVIAKGLGNVTETEVERAEASGAKILAFHIVPAQSAEKLAKDKKVEIHRYTVIYKLVEEVRAWLEAMLIPEVIRTDLGKLKVLAVFRKEHNAMIVGGSVTKGKIAIGAKADVYHTDAKLGSGTITQVQINKISANEVEQGHECGIRFEGKPTIEVGDTIEVYTEVVKQKKLG